MSDISWGSKGEHVKLVQQQLNEIGFNVGRADGIYGRKTRRGICDFQKKYFADGIGNRATLEALDVAVQVRRGQGVELLRVPHGLDEVEEVFGVLEVTPKPNGFADVANDWAIDNIVEADLPIVGKKDVHRLMVPVFTEVLNEIRMRGADGYIVDFLTWSVRYKMRNPKRNLSTHSWGIACDINPATNGYGKQGDMPDDIVDTFELYGFEWGGRWRTPDPMHFQYCTGF